MPAVRFGSAPDFHLGVEEELLLVDASTLSLEHDAMPILAATDVGTGEGSAHPDTYAAEIELTSPVSSSADQAVRALSALRGKVLAAGGTPIGAGIHPDGAFGDVVHVAGERYEALAADLRGLLRRTPTAALHVHVSAPDPETAMVMANGLREHLPLLQALAANSPFWHGVDSGLDTARAQLFRGYPRGDIPRSFSSFQDYVDCVTAVCEVGDLADYTLVWWDLRPHPKLGTIEVRAMDAQASLGSVAALTALIQGLAAAAAQEPRTTAWSQRDALVESSFRAARDGLDATLWNGERLVPVAELARDALKTARPYAQELGSADALDEVEKLLREGNGATRQRRAFARGGMRALLELLRDETAAQR